MSQLRTNDLIYNNQGANIVSHDPYAVSYSQPQMVTQSHMSNIGNGIVQEVAQGIKTQQLIPGGIREREQKVFVDRDSYGKKVVTQVEKIKENYVTTVPNNQHYNSGLRPAPLGAINTNYV